MITERIHDLRHTSASWAYNNGAGLEGVNEHLGHKDPRSTLRYTNVNDDFLRNVSSMLRRHQNTKKGVKKAPFSIFRAIFVP